MSNSKNLIGRIFTKKNTKIFLSVFVVLWFFVWSSFAQSDAVVPMTIAEKFTYLVNILISLLSWVWVVLATLAWKLMTNNLVYGTFLHLDMSLWNLWNIMKNFANVTLWVVLIFTIVKNLFDIGSSGSPLNNSIKIVWKVLVAWILIQVSWFLFWALLDLSTIATAAIWSLPSQFMSSNNEFEWNMKRLISDTAVLNVDFSNWGGDIVDIVTTWSINSADDVKKIVDTIMPSSDSVVWPLIFLWASVFNLYDLSDSSKNISGTDDWSELFLSLWINSFVLFTFSLMLALIFVFNLFRVITLRVIIPLMPFVVLVSVFWTWKNNKITWFLGDILDYKKIIKLVFKPVYMTLVLSIVLIVMVLIRTVVKADNWNLSVNHNNLLIESRQSDGGYESSLNVLDVANIKMKMKNSIVDVLVYVLGLVLMIMLMKSCVSWDITWIKFIDEKISGLSKAIWWGKWEFWWLLWSIWVIPIGDKKVWINSISRFVKDNAFTSASLARAVWIDVSAQDRRIDELLWWSSFSSLNNEMSREDWIKRAVQIWKRLWYSWVNTGSNSMFTNRDFTNRFDSWNSDSRHNNEPLTSQYIQNVWDWKTWDWRTIESQTEETPANNSGQ